MKKCLLFAIVFALEIVIISYSFVKEKDITETIKDVETEIEAPGEEAFYEVSLEENNIAIYFEEKEKRELIKKAKPHPLRKGDEELLRKGLKLKSLEEALTIFEDFVS